MIRDLISFKFLDDGSRLRVETIEEKYTQIFDWLKLQDMNVVVLILLMLIVAGFNMISGLLILILERTNMIGILKGMGTTNASIRKIFLYQASYRHDDNAVKLGRRTDWVEQGELYSGVGQHILLAIRDDERFEESILDVESLEFDAVS